jgi:hypothetical protein
MRTIVDPAPPNELRPAHDAALSALQRGKAIENMLCLEEGYLMPLFRWVNDLPSTPPISPSGFLPFEGIRLLLFPRGPFLR